MDNSKKPDSKAQGNGLVPDNSALPPGFLLAVQALTHIHWGENPHRPPPSTWEEFSPNYIAILHVGLTRGWDIEINHACFTTSDPNNEGGRLLKAVAILEDKVGSGKPLGELDTKKWGTYQHTLANAGHDPNRPYDSGWFQDFNFATQNELFIYLDDPEVRLEDDNLIGFKPLGNAPRPKDFNHSYFYAREVPERDLPNLTGKMIRVRNYATKEDGTLIGAHDNRNYSIDIKFRVPGGSAGMIMMIIDPDTGNGQGNEP